MKTEFENSFRRLNFLCHLTDIKIKSLIEKLADAVNKYNNTYQSTIKMKPVDVKWTRYIDFDKENNKEGSKYNIGDHVTISKYKIIFVKCYTTTWPVCINICNRRS